MPCLIATVLDLYKMESFDFLLLMLCRTSCVRLKLRLRLELETNHASFTSDGHTYMGLYYRKYFNLAAPDVK